MSIPGEPFVHNDQSGVIRLTSQLRKPMRNDGARPPSPGLQAVSRGKGEQVASPDPQSGAPLVVGQLYVISQYLAATHAVGD